VKDVKAVFNVNFAALKTTKFSIKPKWCSFSGGRSGELLFVGVYYILHTLTYTILHILSYTVLQTRKKLGRIA